MQFIQSEPKPLSNGLIILRLQAGRQRGGATKQVLRLGSYKAVVILK